MRDPRLGPGRKIRKSGILDRDRDSKLKNPGSGSGTGTQICGTRDSGTQLRGTENRSEGLKVFRDTVPVPCRPLIVIKLSFQTIIKAKFQISVCCRKDVPEFGPKLPEPPVFKSGPTFRQFLLCKLINAETACYSSSDFHMLRRRNR